MKIVSVPISSGDNLLERMINDALRSRGCSDASVVAVFVSPEINGQMLVLVCRDEFMDSDQK